MKYRMMNEGWPGDIIVSNADEEIDGYTYTSFKEDLLKKLWIGKSDIRNGFSDDQW